MYLLGVKKLQICPFKGTAPATSCCTPKGTILNPYFSVYDQNIDTLGLLLLIAIAINLVFLK